MKIRKKQIHSFLLIRSMPETNLCLLIPLSNRTVLNHWPTLFAVVPGSNPLHTIVSFVPRLNKSISFHVFRARDETSPQRSEDWYVNEPVTGGESTAKEKEFGRRKADGWSNSRESWQLLLHT